MWLRLIGLGHWFDRSRVLFSGLNADLASGRVYAVMGPSGSGKSTLLSLLAGWEQPKEGRVESNGVLGIQWVFQNPHGMARRSSLDHVSLPMISVGSTRATADREGMALLSRFRLGHIAGSLFGSLSGGEAQRLMLARGVAANPDLLLVDEPTAQLDRRTAHEVNAVLRAMGGEGRIVVVATHDPDTAAACDQVIDLACLDSPGAQTEDILVPGSLSDVAVEGS